MLLYNEIGDTVWSGDFIVEMQGKACVFENFNITKMFLYNREEGRDEDHTFIGDRYLWSDEETEEYLKRRDDEFYKWLKGL